MHRGHTLDESVFWYVFDRPLCVRSDVAERFGVSAATVSRAVNVLTGLGLLLETPAGVSSGGRPPQSLQVNPKLAVLAGLDVQLDRVVAVVTDLDGKLLGRGSQLCDARKGVRSVLEASGLAVDCALADAGIPQGAIGSLGLGHSGDLDSATGVCLLWANAPAWNAVPIREKFEKALTLSVTVDDRSRAIALAERRTSPEDWKHKDAIYVIASDGVGMGIFLDGRLYRGASRGGGEFGHTVVDPAGPPCKCGNHGCVEALAGVVSVVAYVRECLGGGGASTLPSDLTIEAVLAAAHKGDVLSRTALERAAAALGTGIANAVQLLNPSLVVLSGKLALVAGREVLEGVRRSVQSQCVESASRRVEIRLARPKKDISAVGCALLTAEAEAGQILRARLFGKAYQP